MTREFPSSQPAPGERSPLPYARQWIDDTDIAAVVDVLRSDFVTQGPTVDRFEAALCSQTGAKYAVAVSSGSAALHLLSVALGLGKGEVGVTSPITFAASANGFLHAGASARFCDVDPATGLMTPAHLEAALARAENAGCRPGVVVAVSLSGRVPDLAGLHQVCTSRGWKLVEDAAHSIGADYRVENLLFRSGSCTHTEAAILSFHPVKHVCAGEGGAVLTNNDELARRIRRLRSHGIEKPGPRERPRGEGDWFQDQVELGFNYRLTDIQAALGLAQMVRLPGFLKRRREIAQRYAQALSADPFGTVLTAPAADDKCAWHLFVVHFKDSDKRLRAYDFLRSKNIGTQVHYIPVYRHSYYRGLESGVSLPGAEAYYSGCLSLPMYPKMSDADVDRVVGTLAEFAATL